MLYQSTRGNNEKVSAAEAIKTGMVPKGGLFVPEKIPSLSVEKVLNLSYAQTAEKVFELFLSDFSQEEI
jgi:threonine synthase